MQLAVSQGYAFAAQPVDDAKAMYFAQKSSLLAGLLSCEAFACKSFLTEQGELRESPCHYFLPSLRDQATYCNRRLNSKARNLIPQNFLTFHGRPDIVGMTYHDVTLGLEP